MLSKMVWSTKPEWVWRGFGLVASRTENSGDPTCSCMTSRFCMDEYGRLWVPDVFRYRVTALDTAGNEICRFGHYGNVDSAGPGSLIPKPAIPLTFPNATVAFNDKVYVIDRKSMRIVVADLTYQSEAVCEMR
jgi:hypothetical protein